MVKNFIKLIMILATLGTVIFYENHNAMAATIEYDDNCYTKLNNSEIQSLLAKYSDEDIIIIHEVVEVPFFEGCQDDEYGIEPAVLGYLEKNIQTTKNIISNDYEVADYFVTSVAKGEEYILEKEWSVSVSGSYEGSVFDEDKLGINAGVDIKYMQKKSFSGPDEGSIYNSREYRVKVIGEYGTYEQTADIYSYESSLPITLLFPFYEYTESRTGTYLVPKRYFSYSIDHKINY